MPWQASFVVAGWRQKFKRWLTVSSKDYKKLSYQEKSQRQDALCLKDLPKQLNVYNIFEFGVQSTLDYE